MKMLLIIAVVHTTKAVVEFKNPEKKIRPAPSWLDSSVFFLVGTARCHRGKCCQIKFKPEFLFSGFNFTSLISS